MIDVREPGVSTTVQDDGRFGNYHIGMPPSGAMDQFAHRVGNFLVGNEPHAATLEMTYVGGSFEFAEDAVVAVTGADMSPTLEGDPVPMWTTIEVQAGETLSFEYATEGVRAYLAVAGGIDVPQIMGSRATYTLIGMGGFDGRALEPNDRVQTGAAGDRTEYVGTSIDESRRPTYGESDSIRVVMGLCDYRLTDEGRRAFLDAEWTVSDEADRAGYRFNGPDVEPMFEEREPPFGAGTDITNVVDVGYPIGSIQLAGEPIVLMRDAVTGGGYATIGTVVSPDRYRLAQRPTHATVTFESVSPEEALEIRIEHEEALATIRESI
ncbi:MAG: biotin-dependent carboxyltransferase family protein [Halobacteriota archaeon]